MEDDPRVHVETAPELAAWFATNHASSSGVWVVVWRTATGRPAPSYDEAVCEALRFGWIDSVQRGLDEERTMQRYTPRRAGSGWSRPNKERIARLEAEGRIEPAGRAVIEAAKADGSWTLLDSAEALEVPDDLAAAFDAHPGSREQWEVFPRSAKRGILAWIVLAKRPATRQRRITETAEKAARGERANQPTPRA